MKKAVATAGEGRAIGTTLNRRGVLAMITILHAFTHVYHVALIPLYLPIRDSLGLAGVQQATLLVTAMMAAYFIPAYPMGVMADRYNRQHLLVWGLLVNALGFVALSFAPTFSTALLSVVAAGLGGSFFHPAATALTAQLYPENPGRAFGLMAMGASIGFFVGPLYSGWRANADGWRAPVLELGLAGVGTALLFAWITRGSTSPRVSHPSESGRLFPSMKSVAVFVLMAVGFSLRDFAGAGNATLSSLYLQNAYNDTVAQTGAALSVVFLGSAISNPLFGHLSDRGRLKWAAALLLAGGLALACLGFVPRRWFEFNLIVFGFFFLATYPVVEAALMHGISDKIRGRFFGLFITVGGLIGNMAHWVVGREVEALGPRRHDPALYSRLFLSLAALMVVSPVALWGLRQVGVVWRARPSASATDPLRMAGASRS